jgi:hypothetical protein
MAYIDAVVEVLRTAPGPLTTHEIADVIDKAGSGRSYRRPSEATITTWLYAITGSHDRPGVHRLDRAESGRGCICWVCAEQQTRGANLH